MRMLASRSRSSRPRISRRGRGSSREPRAGSLAMAFRKRRANLFYRVFLCREAPSSSPDALGLRRGRLPATAFHGLSPAPQTIARVVQRTELRIDEVGTEAAATTSVTTTRSMPIDYVKMVVDKPFVFAVRDRETGLILMSGYVGRLSSGGAMARLGET